MLIHLRRAFTLSLIAIVLTFAYALVGTGVSQLFFTHQADGSITAHGSTLVGQNWSSTVCPGYLRGSCVFQGRPDDLGPYASAKSNPAGHPGDDPLIADGIPGESGATNLGPHSAKLKAYTQELIAYWHSRGVDPTPDLVTTSGSGLDPDITPQDALVQIPMVSRATGVAPSALRRLIAKETQGEQLGFLGSSYVDVLQLNEALAKLR
jgi:K+-transporting ATPase ATPase C chain